MLKGKINWYNNTSISNKGQTYIITILIKYSNKYKALLNLYLRSNLIILHYLYNCQQIINK